MDQDLKEKAATAGLAPDIDWAVRARRVAPVVAAAAERTERDREVPTEVMAALHDAELFRMFLPRSMGGGEATSLDLVAVLEIIAAADASTAWCLGQGLGCSLAAAFVDPGAAREVFGRRDAVLASGPGNSTARAVAVDGGYRVTGEWMFASGSRHAAWLGAHCDVYEADGEPRLGDDGKLVNRTMLFAKAESQVTDVWHVIGLRGTGSDNYAVEDLFVPAARSFGRNAAADRREDGPLYSIPLLTMYGIAFSGVALGIARATLDGFIGLAAEKKVAHTPHLLRDNAVIQSGVAQAEGSLGAARAYLVERIGATWQTASAREDFPLDQRARLRVAITQAMNKAREVVDFAYQAAGTTAIFEANPFERRFRDMHTVSQQGQAQLSNFEAAGQALLGLPPSGHRV